jgi:hypothetical protein
MEKCFLNRMKKTHNKGRHARLVTLRFAPQAHASVVKRMTVFGTKQSLSFSKTLILMVLIQTYALLLHVKK